MPKNSPLNLNTPIQSIPTPTMPAQHIHSEPMLILALPTPTARTP